MRRHVLEKLVQDLVRSITATCSAQAACCEVEASCCDGETTCCAAESSCCEAEKTAGRDAGATDATARARTVCGPVVVVCTCTSEGR